MGLMVGVDRIDGPGVALPALLDEAVYGRQCLDHLGSDGVWELDWGVRCPPFSGGHEALLDPLLLLHGIMILLLGVVELLPSGGMTGHFHPPPICLSGPRS